MVDAGGSGYKKLFFEYKRVLVSIRRALAESGIDITPNRVGGQSVLGWSKFRNHIKGFQHANLSAVDHIPPLAYILLLYNKGLEKEIL